LRTNPEKRVRFFQEMAMKHMGEGEEIAQPERPGQGRERMGQEGQRSGQRRGQFNLSTMTPEQRAQFEERLMRNETVKQEYEKRLKKDPALATDQNKRNQFFTEMMNKMRAERQRSNRQNER